MLWRNIMALLWLKSLLILKLGPRCARVKVEQECDEDQKYIRNEIKIGNFIK